MKWHRKNPIKSQEHRIGSTGQTEKTSTSISSWNRTGKAQKLPLLCFNKSIIQICATERAVLSSIYSSFFHCSRFLVQKHMAHFYCPLDLEVCKIFVPHCSPILEITNSFVPIVLFHCSPNLVVISLFRNPLLGQMYKRKIFLLVNYPKLYDFLGSHPIHSIHPNPS